MGVAGRSKVQSMLAFKVQYVDDSKAKGHQLTSLRPRPSSRHSRRHFLRTGTLAAGAVLDGLYRPERYTLRAQLTTAMLIGPASADVNADGMVGPADLAVVEQALFTRRGFDLVPEPGFDHRADVFGRGLVERLEADSVQRIVNEMSGPISAIDARPVIIAWHYGWYNGVEREPGSQTVRFLGGDYASWDSEIESTFHRLKNECGVTVDALSWIPTRANQDLLSNYRAGYFGAADVGTRHVALLYEGSLSLPFTEDRVDFASPEVRALFLEDFEQMAMFLREARDDTPARVFTLDDRPVVFLFGSHTWGLLNNIGRQSDALDQTIAEARNRFTAVYGSYPYLVGEEIPRSYATPLTEDRTRRTVNFDGIFAYLHSSNLKAGADVVISLDSWYIDNQVQLLRVTYEMVRDLRNRFTELPILVIPSLAAGFAKPGFPTLQANRRRYTDLIDVLTQLHMQEYIVPEWLGFVGGPILPAPIYSVGSWNEEFEGHAVFPTSWNVALSDVQQEGFDLPMAIKQAFGWNHYAGRDVRPGR